MKQRNTLLLLLLVCALALVLRGYQLDEQSLWSDEGLTLYRARQSAAGVLSNTITVDGVDTRDTNPPLYFLLLHFWRIAAGESVFALRYFGVLAGVLSIPLMYVLGKRTFGRSAGLGAALLLAISPFHVWQCQEMRNYPLLIAFNLLSVYGLIRFVCDGAEARRWGWLAVWAAAGLAGGYTHYFGFFVLAYGGASLMLLQLRQRWLWIILVLCGLALLPILPLAVERFSAGQQADFVHVPVAHLLTHAASVYSVGMLETIVQPWWRVAPVIPLAVAGLWLGLRRATRPAVLLAGYLVVPLTLLIALSSLNPLYNGPRHLLIGLPPFLLLAAAGALLPPRRWRWLGLIAGTLVILSQAHWLSFQFTAQELVKDDVKGAAEYLNAATRPDDVIVLHDTLIQFTFDYYYQGAAPRVIIPVYGEFDRAATTRQMEHAGETAGRVWFLSEPTPRSGFFRQYLKNWADESWPRFFSQRFESLWLGVKLDGYQPQPVVKKLPAAAVPTDACWQGGLCLVGHRIATTASSGQPWWPTWYWSAQASAAGELRLSLRLRDPQGQVWAQWDRPLWLTDTVGLVQQDLEAGLPAGLPPGNYQLGLRVLTAAGPLQLAAGGDEVLLEQTMLVKPAASRSPRWLGSAVELVAVNVPGSELRPGHPVPVELTWLTRHTPVTDLALRLQLIAGSGRIVVERTTSPTRSDYPASAWQPGETILGKASLIISPQATTGEYTLRASLLDPATGKPVLVQESWWPFGKKSVAIGVVSVVEWPKVTELPPGQTVVWASFGQPTLAELYGYTLDQSPDKLVLTLHWRSQLITEESYSVFVHLTGPDGAIAGQSDGIPAGGVRPTNSWRPGEVVSDTHTIALTDIPAGELQLWVGLYADPERLPAYRSGVRQPDDRIWLRSIEVVP